MLFIPSSNNTVAVSQTAVYYRLGPYQVQFSGLSSAGAGSTVASTKSLNFEYERHIFDFASTDIVAIVARSQNGIKNTASGLEWGFGVPNYRTLADDNQAYNIASTGGGGFTYTITNWRCFGDTAGASSWWGNGSSCSTSVASQFGCASFTSGVCSGGTTAGLFIEAGSRFEVIPYAYCFGLTPSSTPATCSIQVEYYLIAYGIPPSEAEETPELDLAVCPEPPLTTSDGLTDTYKLRCGHCLPDEADENPFPVPVFTTPTPVTPTATWVPGVTPTNTPTPPLTQTAVPSATFTPFAPTAIVSPSPSPSNTPTPTPAGGITYRWYYVGQRELHCQYVDNVLSLFTWDINVDELAMDLSVDLEIAGMLVNWYTFPPHNDIALEWSLIDSLVSPPYTHRSLSYYRAFAGLSSQNSLAATSILPGIRLITTTSGFTGTLPSIDPNSDRTISLSFGYSDDCEDYADASAEVRWWLLLKNPPDFTGLLDPYGTDPNTPPGTPFDHVGQTETGENGGGSTENASCSDPDYGSSDPVVDGSATDPDSWEGEEGDCVRLISGIDVTILGSDIHIDAVYMCPTWYEIPTLSLLGVPIPLSLIIVAPFLFFVITIVSRL